MSRVLIKDTVNLLSLPPRGSVSILSGPLEVTLGDLHAHALKFLYFLVREGIFNISPASYAELARLYQTPSAEVTADTFHQFESILEHQVSVSRTDCLIRLLGDEVADRGANDGFVLMIFKKLVENKVAFDILFSNHGCEFLNQFCHLNRQVTPQIHEHYSQSFQHLKTMLQQNAFTQADFIHRVNTHYKPFIRLFGYAIDESQDEITCFSHAPIGLGDIQNVANYYHLLYSDATLLDFASTIDRINHAVKKEILEDTMYIHCQYPGEAIQRCAWNRTLEDLDRPRKHPNGFLMHWVHGHDPQKEIESHIDNLDNSLGKFPQCFEGEYTVLVMN